MMFEGLDQIDWKGLGYHVYRRHEIIPQEIRNLLSENPDVRQHAREFLLGGGQDFGDIYDTTPHIIPFLFEILGSPNTPDKDQLLYHLSGVADRIAHPDNPSIGLVRLRLQTYDGIKAGLDTLLALLDDPAIDVRLADIELLGSMTDEVERLIPQLIRRFNQESEEEVQVAVMCSLKRLLSAMEWPRFGLKNQYAPFFKEIVEAHPSHKVRVAAARASVELVDYYKEKQTNLSLQVPALLSQEFLELSAPLDYRESEISSYHAGMIAKDLSRLDQETLLNLLQNPAINTEQTHLIARALLASVFLLDKSILTHWERFPDHDRKAEGLFYQQHFYAPLHLRVRPVYHVKRHYLQAIIDAEKAWEIPTNLFSFFYGLPDSRNDFRELLEKLDSTT